MDDLIKRLEDEGLEKARLSFDCAGCGLSANLVAETVDMLHWLNGERDSMIDETERLQSQLNEFVYVEANPSYVSPNETNLQTALTYIDSVESEGLYSKESQRLRAVVEEMRKGL